MVGAINAAQTVNYGSIDNRINRAKEHAKNNLRYGAPALAAIGATGIVGAVKPDLLTKTATAIGKGVGSVGKFLAEKVFKKGFGTGLLSKVLNNPAKFGAAGLIGGGALWLINQFSKQAYNAGQIDKKYEQIAEREQAQKIIVV